MKKEDKLAKMWCDLNRYQWPKELKNYTPQLFSERDYRRSYTTPMMKLIESFIGLEACLIEWRKQNKITIE